MINSLEKVDIGNVPYHSTITEREIQVLRDFFTIRACIIIIRESVSILLNKDNNNDQWYIYPYRDNAARYSRHYNCRSININTSADCHVSIVYEIYNMVYAPHYIALKNKDCATTCLVV